MIKQNVNSEDLDAWHGERDLDGIKAPARDVVAAWALAAAFALAAVLGPPATSQVAAGFVELRHGVLMLDRELDRVSVRFQSASRNALAIVATQTERA